MSERTSPHFWVAGVANTVGFAGIIIGAKLWRAQNSDVYMSAVSQGGLWLMLAGGVLSVFSYRLARNVAAGQEQQERYRLFSICGFVGTALSVAVVFLSN